MSWLARVLVIIIDPIGTCRTLVRPGRRTAARSEARRDWPPRRSGRRRQAQDITIPPSTAIVWPVMSMV
jgi:hypothetical protein